MLIMKVKLFSHNDMDGISCAILAILAFGKENVDIEYCHYGNINERVEKFFTGEDVKKYDKIFITDISVNEDVAEIIQKYYEECGNHIRPKAMCNCTIELIDHHQTALWMNKYDWAEVTEKNIIAHIDDVEDTCGTYEFFRYLNKEISYLPTENCLDLTVKEYNKLYDFVEIVRKYDTFLWVKKYNDIIPKQWNDLFYFFGRDKFIDSVLLKLTCKEFEYEEFGFNEFESMYVEQHQKEIDAYIRKKNHSIIERDIVGYKAGVVFAEQYISELGNELAKMNPHLDFITIVNPATAVSYRGIKTEINLGEDVASVYFGGGHSLAAGSGITDDIRNKILDIIFNVHSYYKLDIK
jgi:oligoribonuclease NrnB/cAMP/cGMP phosphodiesterase (DHH superfamily)